MIDIRGDNKNINYEGIVFAGVSFIDLNGLAVKITRKRYKKSWKSTLESTSPSSVFGKETDKSSGWIHIVGPIKGFYVIKNGEDYRYDYISDFGLYVEDPCQAVDDKMNIYSKP